MPVREENNWTIGERIGHLRRVPYIQNAVVGCEFSQAFSTARGIDMYGGRVES